MILINPERKELDKQAIKEDKIKKEIEKDFSRDLNITFRRILKDLEEEFIKTNNIKDQNIYLEKFNYIIKKYQTITAGFFLMLKDNSLKSITNFEIKQKNKNLEISEKEQEEIDKKITALMAAWIKEQSEEQSKIIIETNEKEIKEEIENVKEKLRQDGVKIDNKKLISLVLINLKNKFENRSILIAGQNVGMTAEEAKLIEAESLNESSAKIEGIAVAGLVKKIWNAVLDDKTRAAHADADFRYNAEPIPIYDNFIVMGENLKYPRDPNGSPENIMNCRCVMQTIVIK